MYFARQVIAFWIQAVLQLPCGSLHPSSKHSCGKAGQKGVKTLTGGHAHMQNTNNNTYHTVQTFAFLQYRSTSYGIGKPRDPLHALVCWAHYEVDVASLKVQRHCPKTAHSVHKINAVWNTAIILSAVYKSHVFPLLMLALPANDSHLLFSTSHSKINFSG